MPSLRTTGVICLLLAVGLTTPAAQQRRALSSADIDNIAALLKLEDTRQFDDATLAKIAASTHPEVRRRAAVSVGRIADVRGNALLWKLGADPDLDVRAAAVFAIGQLKDPAAIAGLSTALMATTTPPAVAREAAQALGKFVALEARNPDTQQMRDETAVRAARTALAQYLVKAPAAVTATTAPVVGEALLAIGRFSLTDDIAPIARFATSSNVEVRWRATWALFRPRNPAAMPYIVKLVEDSSPEVRFWAVRGLVPAMVDGAKMPRTDATRRLRSLVNADPDRRVRTEALRVIVQYDDENAFGVVVNYLDANDTWLSVSAAEGALQFKSRPAVMASLVNEFSGKSKPLALRITALTPLATFQPEAAAELAGVLLATDSAAARTAALNTLNRLGEIGQKKLAELAKDPAIAPRLPQPNPARGGGAGGGNRGGGAAAAGGGGGGGRGAAAPREPRPDAEYRQLVERWIVPAYNGAPAPRAVWETPKGAIELELYPGDAPFGVEHFMRVVESGDIVGTEFTRLVPNFVAQQQAIRNASQLRDEVNQRGLTRGNLSWASAGLDTGRPGYTLGNTPQPHNEGNFTSLGRVVGGLDVLDKLELGDKVTAAKVIRR